MAETNNILSILEDLVSESTDNVSLEIAADFRRRRIEKNITREDIAKESGVAVSNVVRFEQKGLVSLGNLIKLAKALGYLSEIRNIFSEPKYSTMEELLQIKSNVNRKKAHRK